MQYSASAMENNPTLTNLGSRVRRLRSERGWSRRVLAEKTGLSERFLAQVETGDGNPSILSLGQIAESLGTTAAALLAPAEGRSLLALLGLRGAGKSSVGAALAARRRVPFVELDARVEETAGLSLREIFELHGEESYRRWEREALEGLTARGDGMVLATGGGIVTHPETFSLLKRAATTFWLRATPEEHWDRVVAQGDHRPMANDPRAMANLRELLARREVLYRSADHTVDTSGKTVEAIVDRIIELVPALA
ncbi:MAG TPA: shikimate kinase [Candidatus Polarisedimenticolia bacterium]|nr:shikimate kinase [Candidatus Polarisedimenticolia bacterium]